MNEYEKKIYSCYCLFDDCCFAKAKNETIKQLAERIQFSTKKKNINKWLNLVYVVVYIANP